MPNINERKIRQFEVFLGVRHIDDVFEVCTIEEAKEKAREIKQGLIKHDGYDPEIFVRLAK